MWMLEYIGALLVYPGLFETENDALTWVEMQNVENPQDYFPVFVPVNEGQADVLPPRKSDRERLDRIYRAKRGEGSFYANQR